MNRIVLNNGLKMPRLGLGTSDLVGEQARIPVTAALEAGYRLIDTAFKYRNEEVVGEVIRQWIQSGRVQREDVFLTTKLPLIANRAEDVQPYLKMSLERLKLDYVDLYLVHFPAGLRTGDITIDFPTDKDGFAILDKSTDHSSVWKAMEHQVECGRARSIGLSNFNWSQIQRLISNCRIQPAVLQVEAHAYFQQRQLIESCQRIGLSVTAYASLGSPGRFQRFPDSSQKTAVDLVEHPVILEIAQTHKRTPAQVLLRSLIQRGVAVIPKSSTPQRIRENFQAFDFHLSLEDMEKIRSLDKGKEGRLFDLLFLKGITEHPEYPFLTDY